MTAVLASASTRRRQLTVAVCVAVLGLFAYTVYAHVFANALCCADDSSIAVAAKNLSEGYGYATSVPFYGGEGLSPFDPALSTGPTLVLPAAAVIAATGTTPWAPGFTTATVSLFLLGAICWLMRRQHGAVAALVHLVAMVLLLYLLTPGSVFAQWYSLLGEIPAALLGVAGIMLIARDPMQPRPVAAGSALLGLAVLAKLLVVLAFVPVAGWLLYRIARAVAAPVRDRLVVVAASATAAVPILAFELWKLVSLGPSGYVDNLRDFVEFFRRTSGAGPESSGTGLHRLADNFSIMLDVYGLLPVAVLALLVVSFGALLRAREVTPELRRLVALLSAGGGCLAVYYLALSEGLPRYALMALCFWAAALPCVLLVPVRPRLAWTGAAAAAAGLLVLALPSVGDHVRFAVEDGYRPNQRLRNLEATVDYLERLDGDPVFVGGWWATVVDMEYLLPTVDNFTRVEDVSAEVEAQGPLLVRNQLWVDFAPSALFEEWVARCSVELFRAQPFVVSQCPSTTADG